MSIHDNRKRIKIVDQHICTKTQGNLETLAKKLGLSRAGTHKFLAELKDEGFPIAYSRKERCYYYSKPGKMIGYVFFEENGDGSGQNFRGGVKKVF